MTALGGLSPSDLFFSVDEAFDFETAFFLPGLASFFADDFFFVVFDFGVSSGVSFDFAFDFGVASSSDDLCLLALAFGVGDFRGAGEGLFCAFGFGFAAFGFGVGDSSADASCRVFRDSSLLGFSSSLT